MPELATALFRPGMRVAVACSGGADSVALLRTLLEHRSNLGLVLSIAHMNHGIRGLESDADEEFVRSLASQFDLPPHCRRVNVPAIAKATHKGLEESSRKLRYSWFWEILAARETDAIVTAHTLDDQSETVLQRLLRGAWTEGLSGIQPTLNPPARQPGIILRPFLATTRSEIETWLNAIGQTWREDSSNRDPAFTRNRIRHELLPALAEYNPAIQRQFAHLAALALDEESYWQAELARLLPSLLLPGKAVRGGGRATDALFGNQSLSIEIERLRNLHPALRRRVVRAAAAQLGSSLDFDHTERLLALAGPSDSGPNRTSLARSRVHLQVGLRAERTARELRLFSEPVTMHSTEVTGSSLAEYHLPIPGAVGAPLLGLRLEATVARPASTAFPAAMLRTHRPGDRVTLLHSRSSLKVSEALRRSCLPVTVACPLLEWQGEIVWMHGVALESGVARAAGLKVVAMPLA